MLPPELPTSGCPQAECSWPPAIEVLVLVGITVGYVVPTLGAIYPKLGLPDQGEYWTVCLLGYGLVIWLAARLLARRRERIKYPLRGKPARYDDPVEPACPLDDWDALR